MLDQALEIFQVQPDYDLDLMQPRQTLAQLTTRVVAEMDRLLSTDTFEMVIVQGDTTTTMAGALAAFYRGIPVGHVESGLRTHNLEQPFPEEMNRQVVSRLAALHFAPTEGARQNLLAENIPAHQIHVTGNTGIDAVLYVAHALDEGVLGRPERAWRNPHKKLILVTAHRRESFGDGIERICRALAELAGRPDVHVVYPVHRNPNVLDPVTRQLTGVPGIELIEPLDYVSFVSLMQDAYLIITDSGGIQEEAPSLGKPVLVMRECTERPEAVAAGTVKLVGTDSGRIVQEAVRLLDDCTEYSRMCRTHNPYGDGHASERITAVIERFLLDL